MKWLIMIVLLLAAMTQEAQAARFWGRLHLRQNSYTRREIIHHRSGGTCRMVNGRWHCGN